MSPPPRVSAGLAFDWRRMRVVLFGGQGMPAGPRTEINDTWEWDGSTWTQVSTTVVPAARQAPVFGFDPISGEMVLAVLAGLL